MRIRTQFIMTMLLFGVVLAAISASAIITNQRVAKANEQEGIASSIAQGASELSYLANDYVIYRESQQLERWQIRFASFSSDVAKLQTDTPEQWSLVRNIQANSQRLKEVFDSVVSAFGSSSQNQGIDPALVRVSWSRMAVQSQGLVSDASRLSQLLDNQVNQLQRTNAIVVLALIGVFVAYFLVNYLMTQRRVLKGIAKLHAGTSVIGSGNLDFRIEEKKNDEIGDLSHAFNRMTADLKSVTTSKTELEREIDERKKAEEKLVEQSAMLANVSDAIIGYNTDFRVTYWNQAAEKIYGCSSAEAIGKASNVLLRPTYAGIAGEQLVGRIARDGHLEAESGRRAKNGRDLQVETHVISLRDGSGKITGYVAVDRDITERKKIEAEVAHLASFPELNPNPVLELDVAGNIKYANPAAKTLFPDLMVQGSKHPFLTGLSDTVQREETHSVSRDINIGDSWYEQTVTYMPSNQTFRLYGRDITEHRRAEEALRETRDYLDNLFNYANAPIIVWNPDFEITRFNHAFERLTGRTADEVLSKKLDILFPGNSRESSMDFIRKTAVGERWDVVEIPILHRDGTVRIVLWNSATLYAPGGKTPVATIAQGQDITERKQAEEALKQSNVELEASNSELEAFSYSVSHDLRAPLRSMEGFSSALFEDCAEKLDDQGKQYLRYIQESSNLMAQLIDDLLKLSRVTRSEMNYERVNLSEMAGKIMAELEKTEPDRKEKLSIAPDITAYGDRNLLRVVLENLLGNAWKFSGKSSSPRIEMGTIDYNGRQAYFVRDNGVGFDMTYADKLFKPFQRLHKASEFSGTGIGLATVQRIIRRHGGEVWAESKIGEGATFYFTLG